MLLARPVPNAAARTEPRDGNRLAVYVKTKRPAYLVPPLSWIVPHPEERCAVLDPIGVRVWTLCDGRRTVEHVVDAFAAQYGLTFHEGRVAVTEYLKRLIQRGVLAIVLADER